MMTLRETATQPGELKVPWDLREWAPPAQLLAWVEEELDALDWDNPELVQAAEQRLQYGPRSLLTLLVYAYLVAIYESEEIVSACYTDQVLRSLCGGKVPGPGSVKRFRRENRGLLRWCLARLLLRAVREHYEAGDAALPAGIRRHLEDLATQRLDIARHLDRTAYGLE
jgi:transposase